MPLFHLLTLAALAAGLAGCATPAQESPLSFTIIPASSAPDPMRAYAAPTVQPRSGDWKLVWRLKPQITRQERCRIIFKPGGDIELADAPSVPWATNFWREGQVDITPVASLDMATLRGQSFDHYRLHVVSATQLAGTVSFKADQRWVSAPATAHWVRPAATTVD